MPRTLSLPTAASARVGDPATSQAAAERASVKLRNSQARVLAMFKLYGPMTDEDLLPRLHEAERTTGLPLMSASGARTRRKELVDAGYLRQVETVERATGSGGTRRVAVWGLNPGGHP